MLKRPLRLGKNDLETLLVRGKTFGLSLFNLRVLAERAGQSRFGFVVSAKVATRASSRNLLKRRARSVIQKWSDQRALKEGFWAVFIFKKEAEGVKMDELEREMVEALRKVGLI